MGYAIGIFTAKATKHDYPNGAPSMIFVNLMPAFSETVEIKNVSELPALISTIAEKHGVGYSTTARPWGKKPRGYDAMKQSGAFTVTIL